MKKIVRIIILLVILGGAGFGVKHYMGEGDKPSELRLYGNVDQRKVELSFLDSERIKEVLVEEGDVVESGQVLARQEVRRLEDRISALEAQVKVSEVVLTRLKNGSRPEEIDQAKAAVAAAEAELEYAIKQKDRYQAIWNKSRGAVSEQDVDDAASREKVAREVLTQRSKELDLVVAGPRQEDIDEAAANLYLSRQNLQELKNKLGDAELRSPSRAVVRSRLQEPGDMASPQRPVFSLMITSPKWVRAYVSEVDLGKIKPGMPTMVYTDGYPSEPEEGKVGFMSSEAEFTPKTVQTEELRTSLVYEVRIYVEDKQDRLRMGMPATVVFPENAGQ